MKKTYFAPALEVELIEAEQALLTVSSLDISDETVDGAAALSPDLDLAVENFFD